MFLSKNAIYPPCVFISPPIISKQAVYLPYYNFCMMKKTFCYSKLAVLFLFLTMAFSCRQKQTLSLPANQLNPWNDDYSSVSDMGDYLKWGTYNVHDPSFRQFGEYFYMYSTDAIYRENRKKAAELNVPIGYIQMRRSKDLVHWDFLGWAFPEIPQEAIDWVRTNNNGKGATNIWAPYITKHGETYRLYYCVSAFGKKTSYIGLAESRSPEGPWTQKGCVVKTNNESPMNAIDPTIVEDSETGKSWMIYGSFFGGLYCVEIDPTSGLTKNENDMGHLVARRANYKKDNLEAAEIIYNPDLKEYFLFVSYDALMTTYNIRVGKSKHPEGPYFDYFGKNMADTTDNFPILIAPYKFENHSGWAGTGHCSVIRTDKGKYFTAHQGRLSPRNELMVLHVRETFFTPDGWPVVSPERYAGEISAKISKKNIPGRWEIIRVHEPLLHRSLEAGQVLWGEGETIKGEVNVSKSYFFGKDEKINHEGSWDFDEKKQLLSIEIEGDSIDNLIIFAGHDWEKQANTLMFTGLDCDGRAVWGKRIE